MKCLALAASLLLAPLASAGAQNFPWGSPYSTVRPNAMERERVMHDRIDDALMDHQFQMQREMRRMEENQSARDIIRGWDEEARRRSYQCSHYDPNCRN